LKRFSVFSAFSAEREGGRERERKTLLVEQKLAQGNAFMRAEIKQPSKTISANNNSNINSNSNNKMSVCICICICICILSFILAAAAIYLECAASAAKINAKS